LFLSDPGGRGGRGSLREGAQVVKLILAAAATVALTFSHVAHAQSASSGAKTAKSPSTSSSKNRAAQPVKARAKSQTRSRSVVRRPVRPSEGMLAGLHKVDDPLDLRSSVALVVDQDTDEVLFEKNPQAVLPIASITKVMTALVTLDAGLDLEEELTVTRADRTIDRVRSFLTPGVRLTRSQALHLALMSSENHAAQLLGRTYPGGVSAFVEAMNAKAQLLGMNDSHFADPTGLSPENRSSPQDLVRLVKVAYDHEVIRSYSVSTELALPVGRRVVRYGTTNRLTTNPDWEIGLQKTGYISAAGRCLVMQAVIDGQRVVMVLLDSVGKYSRIGDAQRVRDWLVARDKSVPTATTAPVASVGSSQPL
jgi:D-alanyl-D-alanine endopeptidase (penicillin-binding protein 7)